MSRDSTSLQDAVKQPWRRFCEEYEPLRPDLYRYCRHLTRTPWDAEDLVQDTLARAFVTLGSMSIPPPNPRAWLFRVASNAWLNQVKRAGLPVEVAPATHEVDARDVREAAGSLWAHLAPQERAALVLKEAFDFSLEEIAAALGTTIGAVKAALHRGRGKLVAPDEDAFTTPTAPLLDAFCRAFNARDLEALSALLLDDVVIELPGLHTEYGAKAARHALGALVSGSLADDCGGIAPQWRQAVLAEPPIVEIRAHRGVPLLLCWWQHRDGSAVRALGRVDIDADRISRLRIHLHAPEAIGEVCRELDLPYRTNGYRDWW